MLHLFRCRDIKPPIKVRYYNFIMHHRENESKLKWKSFEIYALELEIYTFVANK